MADATLNQLRNVQDGLIRKMVSGGAVLLAPVNAPEIATIVNAKGDKLITLNDAYKSLGRIAKDGAPKFTPEDTEEEVETWGEMQPSRRDITSSKLNIDFTLQDTRKETLELAARRNLAEVKAKATTNEIVIDDNPNPGTQYYRALILGADGTGDDAVYMGRFLPRVSVTIGEEDWSPAGALQYPVSMTAYLDAALGYSSRRFLAGPGIKARLAAMGFVAAG